MIAAPAYLFPPSLRDSDGSERTLIDELLAEQQSLTAVERFSRHHPQDDAPLQAKFYRDLIPLAKPRPGQQYAFVVDLDKCSGCKACVTACHSLNGLDEDETWRKVGLLVTADARALSVKRDSVERNTPHATRNNPVSPSAPSARTSASSAVKTGRTNAEDARVLAEAADDHAPCTTTHHAPPTTQHITTACHHCVDPACLNGCPVLAYDKDPLTGIVRHLDDQCIGCSYCVMKCPYEVPKYSAQRGIVRKCDMCANRLAAKEAPACVQACPSEAIRIEIVEQESVRNRFGVAPNDMPHATALNGHPIGHVQCGARNSFLPDSPDPLITLPTTRYVSRRPLAENTFAADRSALRLDPPHWPLVAMLLLTQAAAGMFLVAAVARICGVRAGLLPLEVEAFILLGAGLAASVLHLGQPLKAWRAFLGWRKSWLSREIIALNLFAAVAALAVAVEFGAPVGIVAQVSKPAVSQTSKSANRPSLKPASHRAAPAGLETRDSAHAGAIGTLAALVGLLAVFASAMVYIDTRRPFWAPRLVFRDFFGTTLLLGAALAAVTFTWMELKPAMQLALVTALAVRAALFGSRHWALRGAARDSQNPIHFNARVICGLLPWTVTMQTCLFIVSTIFGLLALSNFSGLTAWWASLAAVAAFASEIIARFVFFAASASKRMPGGVAA